MDITTTKRIQIVKSDVAGTHKNTATDFSELANGQLTNTNGFNDDLTKQVLTPTTDGSLQLSQGFCFVRYQLDGRVGFSRVELVNDVNEDISSLADGNYFVYFELNTTILTAGSSDIDGADVGTLKVNTTEPTTTFFYSLYEINKTGNNITIVEDKREKRILSVEKITTNIIETPNGPLAMKDLSDVDDALSPSAGDFLSYDGSKFISSSLSNLAIINTTKKIYTAGEDLTAGDSLYISNSDGFVYKTDLSDTTKINFIGFADTTATTGNDVVVNLTYDDNQSGLTIGDTYFLKSIATTYNVLRPGVSLSYIIAGSSSSTTEVGQSFTITDVGQDNTKLTKIQMTFFARPVDGLLLTINTTFIVKDMSNNTIYTAPVTSNSTSNSSGVNLLLSVDIPDSVLLTPGTQYKIIASNSYVTSSSNRQIATNNNSGYNGGDQYFNNAIQSTDANFTFTRKNFVGLPGEITNSLGNKPEIVVGFADSTTSIQITNKKGGGRIAKGTSAGSGTITTGFYPKQVIYSDTGNTSCYLDEANVSNKTQSGFDLDGAYDWVAFG